MVNATPSKSNQMNQENSRPDCSSAKTSDDSNADSSNTGSLHVGPNVSVQSPEVKYTANSIRSKT